MVRRKPPPFPPEPLAYLGIQFTRWSLNRADSNGGKRNAWLRTLDRLGLGFDSCPDPDQLAAIGRLEATPNSRCLPAHGGVVPG